MPKQTIDLTQRIVRQELVRAIRNIARDSEWRIHFAFEKAGCSCHPQREELQRLETERRERMAAVEEEIDKTLGRRIDKLDGEVEEIDRREHPALDAMGRRASSFFAFWMMERLAQGNTDFLDEDSDARAAQFADAWLNGWRPAFPA